MFMAVLDPPGVTCPQNLFLAGPCSQLTCTMTAIPSEVRGASLAALPRNTFHVREALLLTVVLGVFTELTEGVLVTLAAGHLEWGACYWAAGG